MNLKNQNSLHFETKGIYCNRKCCIARFHFPFFSLLVCLVMFLCCKWCDSLFLNFFVKLSWQKKKLKIYVLKGKRYSKYVHALLYGKPLTYKDLYAIHHMYSSIVTVGQGFFSLFYFTCQALILFGLLTQHMVIQILNFDQNHCLF